MQGRMNFCPIPFTEAEFNSYGEVFLCCPIWTEFYSVGNLFEHSLDEIWNSEKAVDFRKRILNGDYSLCNENACYSCKSKQFFSDFDLDFKPVMQTYPKRIKFCYDRECNISCIICRDDIKKLSDEELKKWDEKIDSFLIPLLKDASILTINAHGDPFASRHSRKVIRKASQTYPDLKFDFITNGIMMNETTFKELEINPQNIYSLRVSIHASTKETYSKMIKHGEQYYDRLMSNLQFASNLKKQYNFMLYFNFVVTSLNYQDMPGFIDLALKHDAQPYFWEYKQNLCLYDRNNKQNLSVVNPDHKDHDKLKEVLKHPNMYIFDNCLYPELKKLQN